MTQKYLNKLTNQSRDELLQQINKLPIEKQQELILVGIDIVMHELGYSKASDAYIVMLNYVADLNEQREYLRSIGVKEEDL